MLWLSLLPGHQWIQGIRPSLSVASREIHMARLPGSVRSKQCPREYQEHRNFSGQIRPWALFLWSGIVYTRIFVRRSRRLIRSQVISDRNELNKRLNTVIGNSITVCSASFNVPKRLSWFSPKNWGVECSRFEIQTFKPANREVEVLSIFHAFWDRLEYELLWNISVNLNFKWRRNETGENSFWIHRHKLILLKARNNV